MVSKHGFRVEAELPIDADAYFVERDSAAFRSLLSKVCGVLWVLFYLVGCRNAFYAIFWAGTVSRPRVRWRVQRGAGEGGAEWLQAQGCGDSTVKVWARNCHAQPPPMSACH